MIVVISRISVLKFLVIHSPGKGNDKGKVEGLVGYVRRTFLVLVPSFKSFDALNAYLERRCLSGWTASSGDIRRP